MATLAACVEDRKDGTSVEAKCPVRRLEHHPDESNGGFDKLVAVGMGRGS